MKYQLWNQDEYGTGVIIGTYTEYKEAVSKARSLVTEANFTNSLSVMEQMRNIEAYFVELQKNGKIDEKAIYAGNRRGGKYWSFKVGESKVDTIDPEKTSVSIYIGSKFAKVAGENVETKVYLVDEKKRPVTTLDHQTLAGKAIYFIVPID
jgi:hypothetical protein